MRTQQASGFSFSEAGSTERCSKLSLFLVRNQHIQPNAGPNLRAQFNADPLPSPSEACQGRGCRGGVGVAGSLCAVSALRFSPFAVLSVAGWLLSAQDRGAGRELGTRESTRRLRHSEPG